MPDVYTFRHRAPIILAAARNNVPAVYHIPAFVRGGGLLSYGPDPLDILSSRRLLCRSHSARREAGRSAGAAADQIRAGHQPEDRQSSRPRRPTDAARSRRRGDRVDRRVAATAQTASGTSRTSQDVRLQSAKWGKADLDQVAVTNRNFMSTRPNARLSAPAIAPAPGGGGVHAQRDHRGARRRERRSGGAAGPSSMPRSAGARQATCSGVATLRERTAKVCRRFRRGRLLSKVQSVDQRMRLECGVGFRQLRTCRRTRPGQLLPRTDIATSGWTRAQPTARRHRSSRFTCSHCPSRLARPCDLRAAVDPARA